jgi:hypothetical protein
VLNFPRLRDLYSVMIECSNESLTIKAQNAAPRPRQGVWTRERRAGSLSDSPRSPIDCT